MDTMIYSSPFPDIPIRGSNLLDHLFGNNETVQSEPLWYDSTDPSKNLSPAQLLGWVRRLGSGLERLGLRRGDVVMICSPNHILVPAAYLGTVGAGLIFNGVNPGSTEDELYFQISDIRANILLAHPTVLDALLPAAERAGIPHSCIYQFSDASGPRKDDRIQNWTEILASPEEASSWKWPNLSPKEAGQTIAAINYSSGTTSFPKGVCVSHLNLIAMIEQTLHIRYAYKTPEKERWIGFLPLYHAYGQVYTILMAIRIHAPVYVMPQFQLDDFLSAIQRYQITSLQVVPPILVMLCKNPAAAKYLSSVKDALCGAAPLSRELQNECQQRFNIQIRQGWGMTETTCASMYVPGGITDDSGSIGQLVANCKARIVDNDGNDVKVGEAGELVIKGPNVCVGYWRNQAATEELFNFDGWMRTGDVIRADERSFFWIVDRKKELIKANGFQVAPAELESVLLMNEHLSDAAVVGITIGESEWPRAYVTLQEESAGKYAPEDVRSWLAQRVAKHKQLVGGVVFVREVPRLPSGKIQRKTLRGWAREDAKVLTEAHRLSRAKL